MTLIRPLIFKRSISTSPVLQHDIDLKKHLNNDIKKFILYIISHDKLKFSFKVFLAVGGVDTTTITVIADLLEKTHSWQMYGTILTLVHDHAEHFVEYNPLITEKLLKQATDEVESMLDDANRIPFLADALNSENSSMFTVYSAVDSDDKWYDADSDDSSQFSLPSLFSSSVDDDSLSSSLSNLSLNNAFLADPDDSFFSAPSLSYSSLTSSSGTDLCKAKP